MKTDPGLLSSRPAAITVMVLGMSLIVAAGIGCASKPRVAKRAPYPSPHVVGVDEIFQRDAVRARARELLNAGEPPAKARRTAEAENPVPSNADENNQWADYARWQKQQAVQTKFEADLDKMKPKS